MPPGERLPFEDGCFDAVVAASSIEQTPDPKGTLEELYRVLKPGGRLRMFYESLACYRGGREREVAFGERTVIYDRHVEEEYVRHCLLSFDPTIEVFKESTATLGRHPTCDELGSELPRLCEYLVEAVAWTTLHPSCRTLLDWMEEIGFQSATATYDGRSFAEGLFDRLEEEKRPTTLDDANEILRSAIEVIVTMEAPLGTWSEEWEPWITAVK